MLIYVDIDDTICETPSDCKTLIGDKPSRCKSSGLHFPREIETRDYSRAKPFPKRIEKINALYEEGNTIIYWTARGTRTDIPWFHMTKAQLDEWGCKYHELRMGKPAYDLFIDDKNICSEDFF
jgi:hypothetical protein